MKPFNLAEAKAGKPIVTRDGRKAKLVFVDACAFFEDEGDSNELCYATGRNEFHTVDSLTGRFSPNMAVWHSHTDDLFMESEKKECWVVTRKLYGQQYEGGYTVVSQTYDEEPQFNIDNAWDACNQNIINITHVEWED